VGAPSMIGELLGASEGLWLGPEVVGTALGDSDGGNLRIGAHQKGERYAQILSDSLKNKGGDLRYARGGFRTMVVHLGPRWGIQTEPDWVRKWVQM
jgi:hypothetical protein